MTGHRTRILTTATALILAGGLAGCGKPASKYAHTHRAAAAPSMSPTSTSSMSTGAAPTLASPAGERAGLDAVAVARAFTRAVCPYSWRDLIPYGQRLDAALTRWGTPAFARAHAWSPARTASAAAGLAEHRAEQSCGQITGGLDPETDPAAGGTVAVRLSVTVTAHGQGSPTSTAQQVFDFQLARHGGGWLISSGQW
ncbi:MAG: hypothetical protein ACJ74U_15410 [Jatrophihabitantaceae bacterium]